MKEISGYPDYVFEMDLRDYFFSRKLDHLGDENISAFELLDYPEGRHCDNKFVLKDMPNKKKREIYKKYYDAFWHFSFFGRTRPEQYFKELDRQKDSKFPSDIYFMVK